MKLIHFLSSLMFIDVILPYQILIDSEIYSYVGIAKYLSLCTYDLDILKSFHSAHMGQSQEQRAQQCGMWRRNLILIYSCCSFFVVLVVQLLQWNFAMNVCKLKWHLGWTVKSIIRKFSKVCRLSNIFGLC